MAGDGEMNFVFHLASGNVHKIQEMKALADASDCAVRVLAAKAMPTVVEDTGSFVGNALKKAVALQATLQTEAWVLADDSGVCVDALGGEPGVESAYYAGSQHDSAANLKKLTKVMREVPEGRRDAQFVCMLVARGPGGEEHVFEGKCNGALVYEPKGGKGFGYDPLFLPDGFGCTYAELSETEKNQISHRARAWAKVTGWLKAR